MGNEGKKKSIFWIIVVLLLASLLRAWAVARLPEDFDEPVYLQVAFNYASFLKQGSLQAIIQYNQNIEHPALVKLIYAGGVLGLKDNATWANAFYTDRAISAVIGVIGVGLLSVLGDPLSGGMLAIHTLDVKYTSQVYLEALPLAMVILAVQAFLRTRNGYKNGWIWLSALALGITAASKYSYMPVAAVVILYIAIYEKHLKWHIILSYGVFSIVVFFAADPSLWHQPIKHLLDSFLFHVQYSQGAHVQEVGYPFYQPFIWIFTSSPAQWHPDVFFYLGFDGIISILAILGLKREWTNRRWLLVWIVAGIIFLLIWPTKWPQYALILTPALCLAASATLKWVVKWAKEQEAVYGWFAAMIPKPPRAFWIILGIFVVFLVGIYLSVAIPLAIGKVGWSYVNQANSLLPSDAIHALQPFTNGRMAIATDKGLVLWKINSTSDTPDQVEIFNSTNSPIPSNRVLSLAVDTAGNLWVGTDAGIAEYIGTFWKTFSSTNSCLNSDTIRALVTDREGHLFVGFDSGVAIWRDSDCTILPVYAGNGNIISLGVSYLDNQEIIWAGTLSGLFAYNLSTGGMEATPISMTINTIISDSSNTVWVGTAGSGIFVYQNNKWSQMLASNSTFLLNNLNVISEVQKGLVWVGTSRAMNMGGELSAFDGVKWYSYDTHNSGYTLAEPTAIAFDGEQRIWVGTRNDGIEIYRIKR